MAFDIQEELKKLPGKPGVYLMHDADDTIIYEFCTHVCKIQNDTI